MAKKSVCNFGTQRASNRQVKSQNPAIFNGSRMDVKVTVTSEKQLSISLKKFYTPIYCGHLTKKNAPIKTAKKQKRLRSLILTCHFILFFVL